MRLYLLQLGYTVLPDGGGIAMPGYLIQTDDGRNVLVDTGFPRALRGKQEEAAAEVAAAYPDDPYWQFTSWLIRSP